MIIFAVQIATLIGAYGFYMASLWMSGEVGLNPLFALPFATVMFVSPYVIDLMIPARNTRRGRR